MEPEESEYGWSQGELQIMQTVGVSQDGFSNFFYFLKL